MGSAAKTIPDCTVQGKVVRGDGVWSKFKL